jgi:hypothetical protein
LVQQEGSGRGVCHPALPQRRNGLSQYPEPEYDDGQLRLLLGQTGPRPGGNRGHKIVAEFFTWLRRRSRLFSASDVPLEDRQYSFQTAFKVVSSSTGGNPLVETGRLVQKGERYFCETSSAPWTYPNIEKTVIAGCETLFVHLFNTGSKDVKCFLPVVLMAQCNWYQENGHPTLTSQGRCP